MTRACANAFFTLACVGCTVSPVDFSEKRCPCDDGFRCDTATDRCLPVGTSGEPGLIAWYRFDDELADGAIDSLEMGHDAVCVIDESCPTTTEGMDGSAAQLDGGADHLRAFDDGRLITATAFTAALWLRPDVLTRATALAKLRDGELDDDVSWAVQLDAAGRLSALLESEADGESRISSEIGTLEAGRWTHVAVAWDGVAVRLYADGVEVGAGAGVAGASRADLLIGGDAGGPSTLPFAGALDEVRLYDRELDADAVGALVMP